MRWLVAVVPVSVFPPLAAAPVWQPAIPGVPPGGFATITVEGVRHGDRHVAPNIRLRIRADRERTTILVKLDDKYLTQPGRPFQSNTRAAQ